MLKGGDGSDIFFFRKGDGRDTLQGFSIGEDLIKIGRGAKEMADLSFAQSGDDVFLTFKGVKITVLNAGVAELEDSSSFMFYSVFQKILLAIKCG